MEAILLKTQPVDDQLILAYFLSEQWGILKAFIPTAKFPQAPLPFFAPLSLSLKAKKRAFFCLSWDRPGSTRHFSAQEKLSLLRLQACFLTYLSIDDPITRIFKQYKALLATQPSEFQEQKTFFLLDFLGYIGYGFTFPNPIEVTQPYHFSPDIGFFPTRHPSKESIFGSCLAKIKEKKLTESSIQIIAEMLFYRQLDYFYPWKIFPWRFQGDS